MRPAAPGRGPAASPERCEKVALICGEGGPAALNAQAIKYTPYTPYTPYTHSGPG